MKILKIVFISSEDEISNLKGRGIFKFEYDNNIQVNPGDIITSPDYYDKCYVVGIEEKREKEYKFLTINNIKKYEKFQDMVGKSFKRFILRYSPKWWNIITRGEREIRKIFGVK